MKIPKCYQLQYADVFGKTPNGNIPETPRDAIDDKSYENKPHEAENMARNLYKNAIKCRCIWRGTYRKIRNLLTESEKIELDKIKQINN